MTKVPATQARQRLPELLNKVFYTGERIAIGNRGKEKAVLVSVEDAKLLEDLEAKVDLDLIRKRLKEPTESWESVKGKLGL